MPYVNTHDPMVDCKTRKLLGLKFSDHVTSGVSANKD